MTQALGKIKRAKVACVAQPLPIVVFFLLETSALGLPRLLVMS